MNTSGDRSAVRHSTVTSTVDGSVLAVDTVGDGLPVVLIGGAFNDRSTVATLAALLGADIAAVSYGRRGRGQSEDRSREYAVDHEIADLASVIAHVGVTACVFGHSSGGVLALEAVARGLPIDRVAVYEPPFIVEGARPEPAADVPERVRALVAAGDRDGAAAVFLTEQVGVPQQAVAGMRAAPFWPSMVAQADSLPYDIALCGAGLRLPAERYAGIGRPSLVANGEAGEAWMRTAARTLAQVIPHAEYVTFPGRDHSILQQPAALVPTLRSFFTGSRATRG